MNCDNPPHFDFRNTEFHDSIELKMVQYRHAKKMRPEGRIKQMKKDHPWSRGKRIVTPELAAVGAIIWKSTLHEMG
ncbi:hypothetical protein [Paraburkholderia ferrariae]|uniref:hypothetical protein n=1 Tax=Paraburkholderia ferrariae TaxID=386056 RepID=UPI0012EB6567|nr:hypothetical protein [Paraburkholderia ferrariae]